VAQPFGFYTSEKLSRFFTIIFAALWKYSGAGAQLSRILCFRMVPNLEYLGAKIRVKEEVPQFFFFFPGNTPLHESLEPLVAKIR
jgi:hypothetical protein